MNQYDDDLDEARKNIKAAMEMDVPLPEPFDRVAYIEGDLDLQSTEAKETDVFTADQMRAYAQEYTQAQIKPLVEALEWCCFWLDGALKCKDWHWDTDQREIAEAYVAEAKALLALHSKEA